VNEKFWWESVKRDAVLLELVAFILKGVLFERDNVEESPKLRLSALEDVDPPNERCGVLVDVFDTLVGHWTCTSKSE